MYKIMIIEDDEEIIEILSKFLIKYNMKLHGFTSPSSAFNSLEIDIYDLIILDLSLPEMDGLEVCKQIRQKSNIPIIISTARSDINDKVLGLGLGADDYIPKPYDPRELVARIQTILRRMKNIENNEEKIGFKINENIMKIFHNDKELKLTLAEYEILKILIEKRDTIISREYIANNVNSIKWESTDRSIDVIIARIRIKLKDNASDPKYIKSIRGIGYRFIAN